MPFEQYKVKDPAGPGIQGMQAAGQTYGAARGTTTVTQHAGPSGGEEFLKVAGGLASLAQTGAGIYGVYKEEKHDKEVNIHMEGMMKDPEGYTFDHEKYDDAQAYSEAQAELAAGQLATTEAKRALQAQQHAETKQSYERNAPLAAAAEAKILAGKYKEGIRQAEKVFDDIPNGTDWEVDWDKKESWYVYANGTESERVPFDDEVDLANSIADELRQLSDEKAYAAWYQKNVYTARKQQNLHGWVNKAYHVNEQGKGGWVAQVMEKGGKVKPVYMDAYSQPMTKEAWDKQGFLPLSIYKKQLGAKKTSAEIAKLEAEGKAAGTKAAAEKMGTIEKNQRGFMRAYEGLSKDKAMDMAVQLTMMPTLFKELEDWAEKEMIDKSDPEEFARYLKKKEEIYGTPEAVLGTFKPRRSTGQLHEGAVMGQGRGIQEGKTIRDVTADETAKKAELADLIKQFGKEDAIRKMREKYPYFGQELGI